MKRKITALLFACCVTTLAAQSGQPQPPENYRPKIHFSPAEGWMSDPNGLVYYDGEYHLCYQHIPVDEYGYLTWGEMYWGHAVSRDLLNWQHMPIALAPDSLGYIFSGCCVADLNNTSGLGTAADPPILAIFTYYDPVAAAQGRIETQSQGLAYSTDRGRTWTKYAANPVLPNPGIADFRDPHIVRHEPSGQWIMVLTAGKAVRFYGSPDCLHWEYLSEFGHDRGSHVGPWECPDLFPLRVEGSKEIKWVLLASVVNFTETPDKLATATQYFIGDFDGKHFTSEQTDTLWIDYGKDNYAGITFDNAPDDRRIFVGWMHSHQYAAAAQGHTTQSWSGAATFPRELSIVRSADGYRLKSKPVRELERLRGRSVKLKRQKINRTATLSDRIPFDKAPIELDLTFDGIDGPDAPSRYGIRLRNDLGEYVSMEYDRKKRLFRVDRTQAAAVRFSDPFASVQTAPYEPETGTMRWRLLVDVASMELFAADGRIVFTDVFFPGKPFDIIELFTEGGNVTLKKGDVTALETIRCNPVEP